MLLRAIEDKRFLPMGSDTEVKSNFQLIAGTNRDLKVEVERGQFREDLFARINLWRFRLPDLRERPEDIEPNLDYELMKFSTKTGKKVRFTQEALDRFLKFALEPGAIWKENFRDLNAAITRMGTFADSGRIPIEVVEDEIGRLKDAWSSKETGPLSVVIQHLGERAREFDPFDLYQLEHVLKVCGQSRSLSDAGRALFSVSRERKTSSNDTDRLKKYLQKFGLDPKSVLGTT
jgi:transcriptional regulatory protein RtcR